jgi:flagellin-like hook-associated protein FlgL
MKRKYLIAGVVAAVAAAGTAGAIAATTNPKETENAVLADAAKRLGVTADQLRGALSQAENAQIDQAVKDGKLTQKQADEIKKHRSQDGTVLGFGGHPGPPGGPGGRPGPGGPGFGGPGFAGPPMLFRGGGTNPFDALAKAIGISQASLQKQFRDGTSLTDIIKAAGKSLADVQASLKATAKDKLDQALKDGKITQDQHDEALTHLDDMIEHLGDFRTPMGGRHFGFGGARRGAWKHP